MKAHKVCPGGQEVGMAGGRGGGRRLAPKPRQGDVHPGKEPQSLWAMDPGPARTSHHSR